MTTPTTTSASDLQQQLLTSLLRTVTPLVAGILLTAALKAGISIPQGLATDAVTALLTAAYYALVRLLELKVHAAWGWFLGLAKAPAYSTAPAPSPGDGEQVAAVVVPEDAPVAGDAGDPLTPPAGAADDGGS